jgi:tetratricopeptide (TPR) repeat protein
MIDGMVAVTPPSELHRLGFQLQTLLRQALPELWPMQVRCALRDGVLMVLVQQAPPAPGGAATPSVSVSLSEPSEALEIFSCLEEWLRRSPSRVPVAKSPLAPAQARPLSVRVYLRAAGQSRPHAFHQFCLDESATLETERAQTESTQSESIQTENVQGESAQGESAQGELNAFAPVAAQEQLHPPLQDAHRDAKQDADLNRADPAEALLQDFSQDSATAETGGFSLPRRAIALAVGVAVLAFGGTFYALTRPCVIGGCAELQTVEQLHQTVSDQLSQGATLRDVSQSYTQLTDASYRLSRVPRWSRYSAAANRVQQQTESTVASLEPILAAQSAATEAVEMTQNPPHALAVWQQAQALWERAIAQLQQVPESSPAYALAQQKRLEYAENLAAIQQRIVLEQKAQDWVNRARQAVELAEARQGAATSMAARLEAHGTWRTAIALLQQVPDTAMAYAEAQQLLALYQPRLLDSSNRLQQEETAVAAHQQALRLADLAAQAEQRKQWSQAVQHWQAALAAAQQVAVGTTVHPQAQTLVASYRTSLAAAQEKLKGALAAQAAEQDLARNCSGTPRVCTYAQQGNVMQVRITPSYDRVLQEAAAITQATQNTDPDSAMMVHFNPLLRAIATIGETAQIPIEVYNADGSLFGIYDPTLDGYVSREVRNQQQKRP